MELPLQQVNTGQELKAMEEKNQMSKMLKGRHRTRELEAWLPYASGATESQTHQLSAVANPSANRWRAWT